VTSIWRHSQTIYPLPFAFQFSLSNGVLGDKRQIRDWVRERMREMKKTNKKKTAVSHPHFIHLNTCTSLLEAIL